jgi:hypothetical protein
MDDGTTLYFPMFPSDDTEEPSTTTRISRYKSTTMRFATDFLWVRDSGNNAYPWSSAGTRSLFIGGIVNCLSRCARLMPVTSPQGGGGEAGILGLNP